MTRHPASYKDPSGFVFLSEGIIYRQVNQLYAAHYHHLMHSGLYTELTGNKWLLPHAEINKNISGEPAWHCTLLPEPIPFISYPYEWSFEQLKDAALLTLEIVKKSVEKGMILKDATPFNIQFYKGRPVFIDTLSFELYDEQWPWVAYRQFCETFLYPLWLSHYYKSNLISILNIYPEGIPAGITAKLLPAKSRMNMAIWLHVLLQNKIRQQNRGKRNYRFSKKKLLNLVNHLESVIQKLDNGSQTAWSRYYSEDVTEAGYLQEKEKIISKILPDVQGNILLDLGANKGRFSLLAAEKGFSVVAIDNDEPCISNLYKQIKSSAIFSVLPLCIDITNPSPAAGFDNSERQAFSERLKPDVVMALAIIHHLAIGKNIPLSVLAAYFNKLAKQLIVEFVPKEDEKTQLLLRHKTDIFPNYTKEDFESCFLQYYTIRSVTAVAGTGRYIYFMQKK